MVESKDFKTRLKIAKSKLRKNQFEDKDEKGIFMGFAFKLGTELVAAVGVGTIIGFILDSWFGTKPWLIIIFFFICLISRGLRFYIVAFFSVKFGKTFESFIEKKGEIWFSIIGVALVAIAMIIYFIIY